MFVCLYGKVTRGSAGVEAMRIKASGERGSYCDNNESGGKGPAEKKLGKTRHIIHISENVMYPTSSSAVVEALLLHFAFYGLSNTA